jgi:uncharacterized protein
VASRTDTHHGRAVALSREIQSRAIKLITSRAVCFEIGDGLARLRFRGVAIAFLQALESAPSVEIVPSSEDLATAAFDLYRQRAGKEWGLTDCMAFVIMRERGITEALTSDEHFEQAGFKALFR